MSIRTRISSLMSIAREAARRFLSRKRVAPAPVPAPAVPELTPEPVASVPVIPEPAHVPVNVVPAHELQGMSRAVDLVAMLRDVDAVFPQIPVKPTSTMKEIQFNAGARHLADWLRQQYLNRGKPVGSMSKPLSI
ncbi:hypothetical protein KAM339_022960 [Aeromonas caviae]|uniref:hypothetical protein n=1 Tax=Aeromonas caviae TaxID=648 RepID=UPI001CC74C28|nr:hypothetical protein [Aeromonas caviae]BDA13755.1 hypothetical protein KAM339_022960 [Aeromonas caviae]